MKNLTNKAIKDNPGISTEMVDRIIKNIRLNNKVREIILFGSRAKGNFKKGSDIDIAIIADDLPFDELIQIKVNITELSLPYNIDIIDFNKISNKELKEHIHRVGKFLP